MTNFCLFIAFHRCEFKTNHEAWVRTVKPRFGPDISANVLAAVNTTNENIKSFYKVRTEMRAAINSLLKVFPVSHYTSITTTTVCDMDLNSNTSDPLNFLVTITLFYVYWPCFFFFLVAAVSGLEMLWWLIST